MKLIDFGLAKSPEDATITRRGHTCGSVPYMSPEQWEAKELDACSDIYSLGATLCHLLTGERPRPPSTIDPQIPDISKEVCERIAKMTLENKTERYQSWSELRKELEAILTSLTSTKLVDDVEAVDEEGDSLAQILEGVTIIDMTHSLNEKARYHSCRMFHRSVFRVAFFGKETSVPPAGVNFELIDHANVSVWGINEHIIRMGEHTGTPVDAPHHFLDQAKPIDEFLSEEFVGPAVVIDVVEKVRENNHYLLSSQDIINREKKYGEIPEKSIVLMYSGWGKRWEETKEFFKKGWKHFMLFPCFSKEAAELLAEEYDNLGVCTECVSIDTGPVDHPAHKVLLGAGKFIIEK